MYSRALSGKIQTDNSIGFIGVSHKVLVIHVHRHLANNVWPNKLKEFWAWLADEARSHTVLMGDFNMSLFQVVPELRSRGVTIDLAAWFPWKTTDATPCADSCGIFFLNHPGSLRLVKGLSDLHDQDPSGILWAGADKTWLGDQRRPVPIQVFATDDYLRFSADAGPGFPLTTYMPKGNGVRRALEQTLTPTLSEAQMEALRKEYQLPKFREKRLAVELFRHEGEQQRGSHYPLCVFTDNPGWRSPEKFKERTDKWKQKCDAQWSGSSQEYHQAKPQSWRHSYGGDGTCVAMPAPWHSDHTTPQSWQAADPPWHEAWVGGAGGWDDGRGRSSSDWWTSGWAGSGSRARRNCDGTTPQP